LNLKVVKPNEVAMMISEAVAQGWNQSNRLLLFYLKGYLYSNKKLIIFGKNLLQNDKSDVRIKSRNK
jgi:hypothetical protein